MTFFPRLSLNEALDDLFKLFFFKNGFVRLGVSLRLANREQQQLT